jgi:hypothetical protein
MKLSKSIVVGLSPNSKLMKEYKSSLVALSQIQREASIGLMLGDASLQTQNNGKTFRLKFEWGDRNKAYVDHVYNLFDEWVLSDPHKKTRISPKGNTVINWGFQTISHEAFQILADLFLRDHKKSIPADLIQDHLTARGLAFWFMDDGGKLDYNKNSKNKAIVLNTHSFTAEEVEKMAMQLSLKFNLDCEVRSNKGKKIIVIKSMSYSNFLELTEPYIIPEMKSKLP